jgi:hypothetical protein
VNRLHGRYADLAAGRISVDDLDDEELARCQLKDINGHFTGKPPKMLPSVLVHDMRRAYLLRAEGRLREALMECGVGVMIEIASDGNLDPAVRLRAAKEILDRGLGKVSEKITIKAEDPLEALFGSILSDPRGLSAPKEFSADEREMLS